MMIWEPTCYFFGARDGLCWHHLLEEFEMKIKKLNPIRWDAKIESITTVKL